MLSVWVLMIRVWNWGHLKQHVFDLWKKNKYFSHFQKLLFPPIRARGHTFYPVFLVWTLPITSSTQWISGITDHHITVDKELQDINRGYCDWYLQISVDFHICVFIAEVTCWLRFSWSSAKANIWTSKRLKWEGYLTLASAHTGWKITWYGSTGFTQLKGIIFLTIIFCLVGQCPFWRPCFGSYCSSLTMIKKSPINDEVPSGLGHPVVIQRRPAVLQLQWYPGVCRPHQFHLEIHWLL